MQGYNYLSFIYGTKDLKGLATQIAKGNFLAFKDGENLMILWSTFAAPPDFDPKPFEDSELKPLIERLKNFKRR
ncbi:hypothetical protein [Kaistella yonginensis]|uniref:hypothetical protein n=1 Tax=Kaistella yonginensis TaxID=658267 RepID=UPI0025B4F97C|nr:hypothetical protein [Kaistella yonginensis]MDN3606389.1 hypothetical protein [Kaistella yonginensis]